MEDNHSLYIGQKVKIVKDPATGTIHDEFRDIPARELDEETRGTISFVYKLDYLPKTVEVRPYGADYCVDVHINCLELRF